MLIPNIELKNGILRGKIELGSWGDYFLNSRNIELSIGGDTKTENVTEFHKRTYEYLLNNQIEILKIILDKLFVQYPAMQEEYGYDEDEIEEYMPNIITAEELTRMISPKRIYILNVEKDGVAYMGFHFECSWDEEQELGVMMYKERVVKIGGADSAFLSWIAEEDRDKEQ